MWKKRSPKVHPKTMGCTGWSAADRRSPRTALLTAGLLVMTLLSALLAGCPKPVSSELRLRKVVLYQNGIGYFERSGHFAGKHLRLRFKTHEIDDVLKTLTVIDRSAGRKARATVGVLPRPTGKSKDAVLDVVFPDARPRKLWVSYAVPIPVWKATYRLVLPDRPDGQALLQAWAVVDNVSGEDWQTVKLSLATGAPMTFALNLWRPRFVSRPNLRGQMVQPAAVGAVLSERVKDDAAGRGGKGATGTGAGVDSDGDGIPDATDKCPNEPETFNNYKDDDGCPDKSAITVTKSRILIMEKIYFQHNQSQVRRISEPILQAIGATLKANPEVAEVEIQGHAADNEANSWHLSTLRAVAVRAKLRGYGVRTVLKVRAYGTTRPLASAKTAEARSRNRRVEFMILKRVDAEETPKAAGPVLVPEAERSVRALAKPRDVAGGVRYELVGRVTIPRRASVMVSLLNQRVSGEEVYLYRPDDAVPGSDKHPLRVARFRNDHGATLEPGPMAIYSRGTFVGEGLIQRLHAGETAFVPFALDSSVSIQVSSTIGHQPLRLVSLVDGVMTVEDHHLVTKRYRIHPGAKALRRIFIRHRRHQGYEARELPPGTVSQPEAYLIPIPLAGQQKSVLEVVERKPVTRELRIMDEDTPQIGLYLRGSELPGAVVKQLHRIIALRRQVATLAADITKLQDRLANLTGQSHEIRASLQAIARSRSAEARAMRQKLMGLLKRSLEQSLALSGQLAAKTAARTTAQTQLRIALREIRITRKRR